MHMHDAHIQCIQNHKIKIRDNILFYAHAHRDLHLSPWRDSAAPSSWSKLSTCCRSFGKEDVKCSCWGLGQHRSVRNGVHQKWELMGSDLKRYNYATNHIRQPYDICVCLKMGRYPPKHCNFDRGNGHNPLVWSIFNRVSDLCGYHLATISVEIQASNGFI